MLPTFRVSDVNGWSREKRRRLVAAMAEKGYPVHWEVRDANEKSLGGQVLVLSKDAVCSLLMIAKIPWEKKIVTLRMPKKKATPPRLYSLSPKSVCRRRSTAARNRSGRTIASQVSALRLIPAVHLSMRRDAAAAAVHRRRAIRA